MQYVKLPDRHAYMQLVFLKHTKRLNFILKPKRLIKNPFTMIM